MNKAIMTITQLCDGYVFDGFVIAYLPSPAVQ